MSLDFIPENYEFPAYIEAVPGIHGAQRITYRPMCNSEVAAMYTKMRSKPDDEATKIVAEIVAPRIRSWSIKGPNGEEVKPTAANFLRLTPTLADKISSLVQGYRKSDPDPECDTPEKSGTELLDASAKNS